MADIHTKKTIELFETVRNQLSVFEDDKEIGGIEKTHIMFDVLEQLLARVLASSASDAKNLSELIAQTCDNIKAMSEEFFNEEESELEQ